MDLIKLINVLNRQNEEMEKLYKKFKIAMVGLETIQEFGDNQNIAKKTLEEIDKT